MRSKTLSLFAASAATLLFATTAFASGAGEQPSAHVRYDDLNLSNDAGVAHLYARLRSAANQVCEYSTFRNVTDQSCAVGALDEAVVSIGNPRLTALHVRAKG